MSVFIEELSFWFAVVLFRVQCIMNYPHMADFHLSHCID